MYTRPAWAIMLIETEQSSLIIRRFSIGIHHGRIARLEITISKMEQRWAKRFFPFYVEMTRNFLKKKSTNYIDVFVDFVL